MSVLGPLCVSTRVSRQRTEPKDGHVLPKLRLPPVDSRTVLGLLFAPRLQTAARAPSWGWQGAGGRTGLQQRAGQVVRETLRIWQGLGQTAAPGAASGALLPARRAVVTSLRGGLLGPCLSPQGPCPSKETPPGGELQAPGQRKGKDIRLHQTCRNWEGRLAGWALQGLCRNCRDRETTSNAWREKPVAIWGTYRRLAELGRAPGLSQYGICVNGTKILKANIDSDS